MAATRAPAWLVRLLVPVLVLQLAVGLTAGPVQAAPRAAVASGSSLVLTPASGPAGTRTTVLGRGFRAWASGTITVAGTGYAVRTDGTGAFSRSVQVPAPAVGDVVPVHARVVTRSATAGFTVLAPRVQPARLQFGVATPGGLRADAELDAVTRVAGESPSIVLAFADFTRELDLVGLQQVAARGGVPLLTWEPWAAGAGVQQPAYALRRIAAGDFDPYLRRWADGLRSFGKPVLLRFGHEMNGSWYPWAEGVNGNAPGDYVAAWRHVHSVVTAAGASNVSWVWSPNVPYPGSVGLSGLYPGRQYVDVVALDGYNFGTSASWSTWVAPRELFGPGLEQLRRLAPRTPILIAETASSELGGSKPAWIREGVAYLAGQPDVMGVVWFDFLKETDWRITSSAGAAEAFAQALLARRR